MVADDEDCGQTQLMWLKIETHAKMATDKLIIEWRDRHD